jgi:hypothetical protein
MVRLLTRSGLRLSESDIGPGAQTGRPGGAGPAGASLGGKIPAGRFSRYQLPSLSSTDTVGEFEDKLFTTTTSAQPSPLKSPTEMARGLGPAA